MVTYKKRGFRNRASKGKLGEIETKSTTASVFNSLDEGSSKTQKWVEKNQNIIVIEIVITQDKQLLLWRKVTGKMH